jgi:hypothetical protein
MADLTHSAHKEGAIGPHRARDVSKDPFGPLGIGGLDLKNIGEKTVLTAHATDVQNFWTYARRVPLWGPAKVYHLD